MRRGTLTVGMMAWLAAAGVIAAPLKAGDTVFIRARNTRVLETPAAAKVLVVLQPGAKVIWRGKNAKGGGWQDIEVNGKRGVVLAASLSQTAPKMEIVSTSGARASDANAFLSSGAATKALGPGAIAYGEKKEMKRAVGDVVAMEKLSLAVSGADIASHARQVGLADAVGAAPGSGQAGGSR